MTRDPRPVAPEVLVKAAGGRALLFQYQTGEGLPPHTHADQAVIVAVLSGRLQLTVAGQASALKAGDVRHVQSGGPFSSLALEDHTRVLVTLIELNGA